jgi:CO/xanthine dehydrogenase FAD-binding subunit
VKPAAFRYLRATSIEECLQAIGEHGEDAKVLAGGQSLVPLMNLRLARPQWVVDINRIPDLDYIVVEGDVLRIGATTRHRDVAASETVARACPLLSQAAAMIGYPAIRNRGTLGGTLAHADPSAEVPCVARATDAEIVAAGRDGRRVIPAREFFTGYFETALDPTELLIESRFPVARAGEAWQFREFTRKSGDFAVAAAGVGLAVADGLVSKARIAVGGVTDRPLRATNAEERLSGRPLSDDGIAAAAELVTQLAGLEASDGGDAAELASILTGRALHAAAAELRGAS